MEKLTIKQIKKHDRKIAKCIIDGIDCTGIVFVEDENVYLLQNKKNGHYTPKNEEYRKYGYSLTWCIVRENKITKLLQKIELL